MAAIGGFRYDLSITRKTDGNFENVSAGVLFSKNSSHILNFIVIGQNTVDLSESNQTEFYNKPLQIIHCILFSTNQMLQGKHSRLLPYRSPAAWGTQENDLGV